MPREFNCRYCGVKCVTRDTRSHMCKSADCLNAHARAAYERRKYPKVCAICHSEFQAKGQEKLCPECKGKPTHKWQDITIDLHCPDCGCVVRSYQKRVLNPEKHRPLVKRTRCKQCTNAAISNSKLRDKNPNWKGGSSLERKDGDGSYVPVPDHIKLANRNKARESMRQNNPMHDARIRQQVSDTLIRRYAAGELVTPTGRDHWRWRGNRRRSFTIRTRVYRAWAKPLIKAADRTCAVCGDKDHRKEVHHSEEKFADIIKQFSPIPLEDLTYEQFEEVSQNVVDYHVHKPVAGQVLCVPCHKQVDQQRR